MIGSEVVALHARKSPIDGVTPPAMIPEHSSILCAPARSMAWQSATEHPTISTITPAKVPEAQVVLETTSLARGQAVLSPMSGFGNLFDLQALQTLAEVMVKLAIGAMIGAAIGFERELHGRPAGIRTHMLMVLGVVLFCEVSKAFAPNDQARIASQVLTGVGFLGAGTILRVGIEIKGLTSAASMWAAAALGMSVSVAGPFLWVALLGTVLCVITLDFVDKWERHWIPAAHPRILQVQIEQSCNLESLLKTISDQKGVVKGVRFVSRTDPIIISMDIQGPQENIMAAIASLDGVLEANWSD